MATTFISTLWLYFKRWQKRNRTIRIIAELDDHMLRDIGLDRYDIPDEVDRCLQVAPAVVNGWQKQRRPAGLSWRERRL